MTDDALRARVGSLRAEIDALDDEIVTRLAARARLSIALGHTKRALGRPLRDEAREAEVVARLGANPQAPLTEVELARIQRAIMQVCLEVQTRVVELGDTQD